MTISNDQLVNAVKNGDIQTIQTWGRENKDKDIETEMNRIMVNNSSLGYYVISSGNIAVYDAIKEINPYFSHHYITANGESMEPLRWAIEHFNDDNGVSKANKLKMIDRLIRDNAHLDKEVLNYARQRFKDNPELLKRVEDGYIRSTRYTAYGNSPGSINNNTDGFLYFIDSMETKYNEAEGDDTARAEQYEKLSELYKNPTAGNRKDREKLLQELLSPIANDKDSPEYIVLNHQLELIRNEGRNRSQSRTRTPATSNAPSPSVTTGPSNDVRHAKGTNEQSFWDKKFLGLSARAWAWIIGGLLIGGLAYGAFRKGGWLNRDKGKSQLSSIASGIQSTAQGSTDPTLATNVQQATPKLTTNQSQPVVFTATNITQPSKDLNVGRDTNSYNK